MILKTSTLALILSITWVNYVYGAPYSNVYVQSGREALPVEYFQYGSPSFPIAGGQYAQLSAAPLGSNIVPVSSVLPCGSSCFYPSEGVVPISQFATAPANLVAYNSRISSEPVVVPREDTGYQYSYVVYDEHTGDHKAQREHSDGSVVRGDYSFIQPDGYVREVQYVADDLNGFNAIVKNYLPAPVGEVKVIEHIEKKIPAPCIEVKNEPFIEVQEIIEEDTHEPIIELISANPHSEHVHHEEGHHKDSEEAHHELTKEPHHLEGLHHSDIIIVSKEHHGHPEELHHGHPEESHHGHEDTHHVHPEETQHSHTKEVHHDHSEPQHHEHSEETQHSHPEGSSHIEVVEIVNCAHGEGHNSHPGELHSAHLEESKEEHHDHSEHPQEHDEGSHHEHEAEEHHSVSEHREDAGHSSHHEVEEAHGHSEDHEHEKTHDSHTEEHHHDDSEDHEPEERSHHSHTEVVLIKEENHPEHAETAHHSKQPYDEVIRCVQTAVDEANEASRAHNVDKSSPTYIILNQPC